MYIYLYDNKDTLKQSQLCGEIMKVFRFRSVVYMWSNILFIFSFPLTNIMVIGFSINNQMSPLTIFWVWLGIVSFFLLVEGILRLIEHFGWACVLFEKDRIVYKEQTFEISVLALGYCTVGLLGFILSMGTESCSRIVVSLPFAHEDFNCFVGKGIVKKLQKKFGYDIKRL